VRGCVHKLRTVTVREEASGQGFVHVHCLVGLDGGGTVSREGGGPKMVQQL